MTEHTIARLTEIFDENDLVDITKNPVNLLESAYENMETGLFKDAVSLFSLYLSEATHSSEALNGLAVSLFELEKYDNANKVVNYALKLFPNDAVSLANKAALCWEAEDYESAVYYFNRSIDIDPDMIESQINLVNLYREYGDILLAYTNCLKLQRKNPKNKEIADLTDSLLMDVALMFY